MELVIDIPNYDYEYITNGCIVPIKFDNHIYEAIRSGTPLPKGHGDLVDFDGLCKEYWDGNYMEIHKDDLSNIKPIIKADDRNNVQCLEQ